MRRYLIMMIIFMVLYCCAESFVLPEKPRRVSPAQLKQELADQMSRLLERKIDAIERDARIQKKLCEHIRGYAQGEKDAFFSRASRGDIERLTKLIIKENERLERISIEEARLLKSLQL